MICPELSIIIYLSIYLSKVQIHSKTTWPSSNLYLSIIYLSILLPALYSKTYTSCAVDHAQGQGQGRTQFCKCTKTNYSQFTYSHTLKSILRTTNVYFKLYMFTIYTIFSARRIRSNSIFGHAGHLHLLMLWARVGVGPRLGLALVVRHGGNVGLSSQRKSSVLPEHQLRRWRRPWTQWARRGWSLPRPTKRLTLKRVHNLTFRERLREIKFLTWIDFSISVLAIYTPYQIRIT